MGDIELIRYLDLEQVSVKGGDILKIIKKSDNSFIDFEEIYISNIDFEFIKGWKKHNEMTLNLIVPSGDVQFYFVNEDFSKSKKINIGEKNQIRLIVPPRIWFCFMGISKAPNLILNMASIEHDLNEVERISIMDFPVDISKI